MFLTPFYDTRVGGLLIGLTVILIGFVLPSVTHAQFTAPINLTGWAWSGYTDANNAQVGAGWISLHCRNTDTCGSVDYGVRVETNGTLRGWAWSGYQDTDGNQVGLGWIDFNVTTASIPAGFPNRYPARLDTDGQASGWVRVRSGAAANDGWDGWISLSGANYGLQFSLSDGAAVSGSYGWGGNMIVGWIDFSRTELTLPDLTIPSAISYQATGGDMVTGRFDTVTFSFPNRNIGNEHTNYQQADIAWRLQIEDIARGGSVTRTGTTDALAPGEQIVVTATENNFLFGRYRLTAIVDPDDEINEWDIDNNERINEIIIEPVDIDVSIGVATDEIIRAGDTATITWSRTDVEYDIDCRLIGPGLVGPTGAVEPELSLTGTSGTVETNERFNFSRYQLVCTEPITDTTWQADVSVEVVPAFQEI